MDGQVPKNGGVPTDHGCFSALRAPDEFGSTIYRLAPADSETLLRLEHEYAPLIGAALFFEPGDASRLTPFAARLFRKGYVTIRTEDLGQPVQEVVALDPAIERRVRNVLASFLEPEPEPAEDDVVIAEADLPFEGPLGALPAGMAGRGRPTRMFGVRGDDDPVAMLENILYGRTEKDDPEGSHQGEHDISEGVDR